ncbi:aromatic compound dioxygenase [Schizopora paradoxa]|uniref:Aromatic compound dioxygenase n=1 Tax=Schizopora paradoxa TaxID=27342 RepID=A0A0H2RUA0_9AGAM|nr:aromatic compound dioxygenase [Schizopora paradoxa]
MSDPSNAFKALKNSRPPPPFELPLPESPDVITANMLKLNTLTPSPRMKFIMDKLVEHTHKFVNDTNLTTEEWMTAIQFLTRVGQKSTDIRQEFILLSDVMGISALVDALNNPTVGKGTESSVLGPFFTEDASEIGNGESIASEGKGEYMWVEGRVLNTAGQPIANATIDTWETDHFGLYDTQYKDRGAPDCRGRLKSGEDGSYAFRAVVPVSYPIPGDGPVGEILEGLGRHNMRPNHLHMMLEAPGYRKLTTALYPEGDTYLTSDVVFGVKKSLVVSLEEVKSEAEARAKGFPTGDSYKLLKRDFIMVSLEEAQKASGAAK